MNLLIFSRLFACFAGPFPGAKAGGFAYEWGKGWSLRLRMGQRLEPSLTHEAKAGAFAYNAFRGPPKSTLQLQNSAVATIAAGVKMTL